MTPELNLNQQSQPIAIGPNHGYRIDGDSAFINADLLVAPNRANGWWTLELWASEQPHQAGEPLTGVQVANVNLAPPSAIAATTYHVETRTDARSPAHGRPHHMVLAVVHHAPDATTTIDSFANYPETNTFIAPHLQGAVGYRIDGDTVTVEAEAIVNPRDNDNLSGSLAIELWAFPEAGATGAGVRLASAEIERVAGGAVLAPVSCVTQFQQPPAGRYRLALILSEWTHALGYVARDRRDFGTSYESSAPAAAAPRVEPAAPAQPAAPVAEVAPARSGERLRLVPPSPSAAPAKLPAPVKLPAPAKVAEPAKPAAPSASAAPMKPAVGTARTVPAESARTASSGLVSIQTASVAELASVKGLNRKLAEDIVKARPFASVADLSRVRGIGPKTIEKLKTLLKV